MTAGRHRTVAAIGAARRRPKRVSGMVSEPCPDMWELQFVVTQ